MLTRRSLFVAGAAALVLPSLARAQDALSRLRTESGGRLGLAVFDTGTGRRLMLDPNSRYAMCSTFKVPLAAAILARVDKGELKLDQMVRFSQADVLDYAPVVKANVAAGQLSLEQLCEAIVTVSDNSAANLLLPQVGGPRGLTRFIREQGDAVTRLDRDEPSLNVVRGGDERDTTTPLAMIGLMETLLVKDALSAASRAKLIGWMRASTTGAARLRAGLPAGWDVGDKTGTSGEGYVNDIAIVTPPGGRKPILIAAYLDAPGTNSAAANAVHAKIGAIVGQLFA